MTWYVRLTRMGPTVRFGPFDTFDSAVAWCKRHLTVAASIIPVFDPEMVTPGGVLDERVWHMDPIEYFEDAV